MYWPAPHESLRAVTPERYRNTSKHDTILNQKTQCKLAVSKTFFSGLIMLQSCDLSLGDSMAEAAAQSHLRALLLRTADPCWPHLHSSSALPCCFAPCSWLGGTRKGTLNPQAPSFPLQQLKSLSQSTCGWVVAEAQQGLLAHSRAWGKLQPIAMISA